MKVVECVPNFSEGRNKGVMDEIARVIAEVDGVELLDVDMGAATNRTVVTFVGGVDSIAEAAFAGIKKASELIDMSKHKGAHQRMGATDVCPFVPVAGVTMEECVQIAKAVGKRVGEELEIPVFLYEEAAIDEKRSNLADIREGEYEGLSEKLQKPEWKPDFGKAQFNEKSGATVIGARQFLIAYNVNVNSRHRKIAKEIALNLREKGRAKRDEKGKIVRDENKKKVRTPGKFTHLKGVGWYIDEYDIAQVSFNFTDYKKTSVHEVFDACCREAEKLGARVTGSELVGLIPLNAMLDAGKYYLKMQKRPTGVPEEELIHIAVQSLGLNNVQPFDPQQKIVEYRLKKNRPLVSMTAGDFVKEVSTDSPAPGGGSVSALAGALAAALTNMACNLTVGKKGYEEYFAKIDETGCALQRQMQMLLESVDNDTEAFNDVIMAKRLPKKTPEEKKTRSAAIQQGYKQATRVPLETARMCLDVLKTATYPAKHGNKNSASDVAVGSLMGYAGFYGSMLNVLINLPSIKDLEFRKEMTAQLKEMESEAAKINEEIVSSIRREIEKKIF